jgi:hypothetical protein
MSLSFDKNIVPVAVLDPRVMVANSSPYAVLVGGSQVTWKQYTSASVALNAMNFSCYPPNGGVFTDRKIAFYCPIRLIFTGTPAIGQRLLRPGYDAPRAWPLMGSIDTYTLTLNNQAVSINFADIIHPLADWYNTCSDLKATEYSGTPCYPDQSTEYSSLIGTARNPLGNYAEVCDNVPAPRGSFPFTVVSNDPSPDGTTLMTAIVDMAPCEELMLPPLWWGKGISNDAFINLTTEDHQITFLGQAANRMWSHSPANGGVSFDSISYVFGNMNGGPTSFPNAGVPTLLHNYITPKDTMVIPPNMPISYPYFDIQRYPTTGPGTINAGQSTVIVSNNIQLSSIPRRFYLYVRQQNQDLYASSENTDTYFAINTVSIQWANKNGLLASASPWQLWQMCQKNHSSQSWTQFQGYAPGAGATFLGRGDPGTGTVGSVICVEMATDIGLDAIDAPGKLAQATLQIQVNCTNTSSRNIFPTLYIVTVSEGVFTIEGLNRASKQVGVITGADVLNSQKMPGVSYQEVQNVVGGDFFSGLKDGLKRHLTRENISKAALAALPLAHAGLKSTNAISRLAQFTPLAPAAPLIRSFGYGEGEGGRMKPRVRFGRRNSRGGGEGGDEGGDEGGVLVPGGARGGVLVPGGARGGAGLSRDDLAQRILY